MALNQLTAIQVTRLSEPGRHADGGGLYLNIKSDGSKSWLFRFQLNGVRSWMGLGGFDKQSNSLSNAREKAADKRALVAKGINPIEQERQSKHELQQQQEQQKQEREAITVTEQLTFEFCAKRFIHNKQAEWKNEKHKNQWYNTLSDYVYPVFGQKHINEIDIADVRKVLDPIWLTKTETATRVRQRIEVVISSCIALGERTTPNPATWKGLLDNFYPKPAKVKRKKHIEAGTDGHFAALPYDDMPEFMAELVKLDGIAPLALRFLILTVPRTTELRLALPKEIDIDKKIWTIPEGRMKASKRHRIALSDAAIETFQMTPRIQGNDYIFAGWRRGQPMSDSGMASVLRKRLGVPKEVATVHGFRSTFRDYVGEETGFPDRLAEFAIAHQLTDEAEKAYARGDKLKKRFAMMNAWANYCDSKIKKSNIVVMTRRNQAAS